MVIAGPGSGKTFTIVSRILFLIHHHHIPPEKILVITYTRAAAQEMKERFEKAVSESEQTRSGGAVNFGTFHSICYHILKQSGVVHENSLIGENDKRKLLQVILGNMGFSSRCNYDALTALVNSISRLKNCAQEEAEGFAPDGFSDAEFATVRREYDRHLEEMEKIDFDDMIVKCLRLFHRPEVVQEYRKRFSCILVDEFQDINPPQYQILKRLAAPSGNLFVVGDDDQAIYGFRGAAPGIMRQFGRDFQGAEQIMLTENYRCGAQIVRMAERMISCNGERFAKKFVPVRAEGKVTFRCFDTRQEQERELIRALSACGRAAMEDTAVIVRTNREAALYAGSLKEAGIAVKGSRIKEEDIYHGFIMQDVTAFLSFLYEGRRRDDFICFMNKPGRFLTRMALTRERVEPEQLEKYYEHNPEMLGKVRLLFRQLHIAEGLRPDLAVSFFRKMLGYDGYLKGRAGDERHYQSLLKTADQVQKCFEACRPGGRTQSGADTVRAFVRQKAEASGNQNPLTIQEEGVHILTMHGAKGLEFERVFLPDLNEGVIPGKNVRSPGELEEERRLLYVAVTRARRELYLYCTRERGRKPSRYLGDAQISEQPVPSRAAAGRSSQRYSSSTISSNSTLSRYSSKASETISYSSSSSI